jgi:hypothetical protein
MGIWEHPYTVRTVQVGGGSCWGFGGRPSLKKSCNVIIEAATGFRLDPPYWMYINCFGTLICFVWAYETTLTVIHLCRWSGVDFGVLGVDLSPNDVLMSWLRLQQASDWIPHLYWMYIKCFGTFICCVWAYGITITVICLCRSEMDFGVLGVDLSPNNVVMSLLRPQQDSD